LSNIKRLDNFTINQIAAGEVVDRPASVVKELVENSIDAQASAITVEIENGGLVYIRVTDNGTGMDHTDAIVSFERHATSKITSAADLGAIYSLGFRGEALASIAAVSQVEMVTRERDSLSGCRILNNGGSIIENNEAGCPEGTTIVVRNLFYNTPARLKFVKSVSSETKAVSELVAKYILARPDISFRFINNGSTVYHSPGNGNLLSAIYTVYGKSIKDELIYIDKHDSKLELSLNGYIGKPSLSRTNRNHQSFFVNGRYIKSRMLSSCIESAAAGVTMINHFPWAVLNITISPGDIDVNIHPSKTEIRFNREEEVYEQIFSWIKGAIEEKPYIPQIGGQALLAREVEGRSYTGPCTTEDHNIHIQKLEAVPVVDIKTVPAVSEEAAGMEIMGNESEGIAKNDIIGKNGIIEQLNVNTNDIYDFTGMKVIGIAFDTYILLEMRNQIYIIDQHAAHERLIYERLKESIHKREILSQQLVPAFILEVTHDEYLYINDNLGVFTDAGFELEPFGRNSFAVRGVPVLLKEANIRELFNEIIDKSSLRAGNDDRILQQDVIIKTACKKAIKANDRLSDAEIRKLVEDISLGRIPMHCPHGRPIMITLNQYDLEKKFKRVQ